jgi:peptidoglycan/xylan/chitin deacetylase (PgdA/CDA1 family)
VELDQADFLRPSVIDVDYQQFVAENEITRGDATQAKVALTFDCEGSGDNMQEILDILEDYQLKGTFFLEGQFARNYPHMIERVLEYGHEVANHSLSHKDFKQLNRDEAHFEVDELEELVSNAARRPIPMRFFRFPFGSRDQQQLDQIAELGYQSVFWSVDPMGWRADATPQQVAETIISESENGAIILMHCHPQADRGALPIVIEGLQKKGFAIESVSNILRPEQFSP